MSYTRSFTKTITVHYSTSVSYPASQTGGVKHVSGTTTETVHVNVHVDTNDFDRQVDNCNHHIDALTSGVVATESAQVASIHKSSIKVSKAIIDGFFKSVKSELSQQIAALASNVEATLTHLHELAKRCTDKQRQMQVDYDRICSRYQKTFEDLNKELENRIFQLDAPTFKVSRTMAKFTGQDHDGADDRVTTVAVSGPEEAALNATLAAAVTKQHANKTIGVISRFLARQMRTDRLLKECSIAEAPDSEWRYIPALYAQMAAPRGQRYQCCHVPASIIHEKGRRTLEQQLPDLQYPRLAQDQKREISAFFDAEMQQKYLGTDPHTARVRNYIRRFFAADMNRL